MHLSHEKGSELCFCTAAESAAPQAEVMQGIAACVVICRFEAAEVGATDDDDTVLYKILMVQHLAAGKLHIIHQHPL